LAIDLNPLSRTSKAATVMIVDEVTRAIPNMIESVGELKTDLSKRRRLISTFDNKANIKKSVQMICKRLQKD